jgi:hypothetical protein
VKPKADPRRSGPTPEEVKAARKARSAADKILRAAMRARRRRGGKLRRARFRGREEVRDFYLWEHDLSTLLPSIVRDRDLPPAQAVQQASVMADRMALLVQERKPEGEEGLRRRRSMRGARGARHRWYEWQSVFDGCVHALVERSNLSAAEVVGRAKNVADAAMKVIDRRRAKAAA